MNSFAILVRSAGLALDVQADRRLLAFIFIGMFLVPESPRWLTKWKVKSGAWHSKKNRRRKIRGRGHGGNSITLAGEEIQHVRFADLLEPKMRKVIVLGVVLAVFSTMVRHQRVIFNYAEEIFMRRVMTLVC